MYVSGYQLLVGLPVDLRPYQGPRLPYQYCGPLTGTVPGTVLYSSAVFPCAGVDLQSPKMRTRRIISTGRITIWYLVLQESYGHSCTTQMRTRENQFVPGTWYQECRAYTAGSPIPCIGPIHRPSDLTNDDDFDTYCLYDIK